MRALFSHVNNPFSEHPINNEYIEMTALANYFAREQGFETVFWGDEKSLLVFNKINFNHTAKLPTKILENFPKCFWSASKLLSLSLTNEPCIHIDNDLFLTKPIPENFLRNDICCFHDEHFAMKDLAKMQDLFKIRPKETLSYEMMSYNCGIIGGEDIKTIKKSIDILFNFISNKADYIDKINLTYNKKREYKDFFYTSVLIEQIWLFQIYKYFGKEITQLIHPTSWGKSFETITKESGYLHLMKQKDSLRGYIKKVLNEKNIKY